MARVKLYTWTFCPFCIKAKDLLEEKSIPYIEHEIYGDDEKKKELYLNTGQNTVPFIFIDEAFIGGYNELKALDRQGKLEKMTI